MRCDATRRDTTRDGEEEDDDACRDAGRRPSPPRPLVGAGGAAQLEVLV